jgi:hypothetical protein
VLNLDKNMLKESDFFGHLYNVKKYSLMAENHYGKEINRGSIAEVKNRIEQIDSVSTLVLYAKAFAECIRNTIPNDLLHIWENADYDEYTDKYHHRCYWSQIENHAMIDLLLKRFCDLNDYETDENRAITANKVWNVRIHDFNNYDIYFSSETEVNTFTSAFDIVPYTVYKYKDKNWEEQYMV